MSLISANLHQKLAQCKQENKKVFTAVEDIRKNQDEIQDCKKQVEKLSNDLVECHNKLFMLNALVQKIEALEKKIESMDERSKDYTTKEVLMQNLNELSDCIESYIVNATPRIQHNESPIIDEEKLNIIYERLEKLENKASQPVPELHVIKEKSVEGEVLFRKPQKRSNSTNRV